MEKRRWVFPFAGLAILSMLGSIYAFSLYYSPLQSYYNLNSIAELALAFSLITVSYSIFIIPAGFFYDRFGPKIPVLLGAFVIFLGYFVGYSMKNFLDWNAARYLYYLGLGILPGLGIAIVDAVPRPLVAKWFPDKTGTAVGIAAIGFGIGTAIVTPIIRYFLSATNVFQTFLYMGILYFSVIGLVGLILKDPEIKSTKESLDFSLSSALRDRRFHVLWLSFALASFAGLMFIGNAVPILKEGAGEEIISAFLIVTSFFNAGGRFLWGVILDKTSVWWAMQANFILTSVALLALTTAYKYPITAILLGGIIYANYGGLLALFPSATAIFFGKKYLGRIYGAIFTSWGVAGLLGAFSGGLIKDLTASYISSFYLAILTSLIAILIVHVGKQKRTETKSAGAGHL
ncbi:MAG: OFA family MFS transporter [Archaeoglobus sp.]|nr:OFA family MFS transporter [Archaeoglobus sp.]